MKRGNDSKKLQGSENMEKACEQNALWVPDDMCVVHAQRSLPIEVPNTAGFEANLWERLRATASADAADRSTENSLSIGTGYGPYTVITVKRESSAESNASVGQPSTHLAKAQTPCACNDQAGTDPQAVPASCGAASPGTSRGVIERVEGANSASCREGSNGPAISPRATPAENDEGREADVTGQKDNSTPQAAVVQDSERANYEGGRGGGERPEGEGLLQSGGASPGPEGREPSADCADLAACRETAQSHVPQTAGDFPGDERGEGEPAKVVSCGAAVPSEEATAHTLHVTVTGAASPDMEGKDERKSDGIDGVQAAPLSNVPIPALVGAKDELLSVVGDREGPAARALDDIPQSADLQTSAALDGSHGEDKEVGPPGATGTPVDDKGREIGQDDNLASRASASVSPPTKSRVRMRISSPGTRVVLAGTPRASPRSGPAWGSSAWAGKDSASPTPRIVEAPTSPPSRPALHATHPADKSPASPATRAALKACDRAPTSPLSPAPRATSPLQAAAGPLASRSFGTPPSNVRAREPRVNRSTRSASCRASPPLLSRSPTKTPDHQPSSVKPTSQLRYGRMADLVASPSQQLPSIGLSDAAVTSGGAKSVSPPLPVGNPPPPAGNPPPLAANSDAAPLPLANEGTPSPAAALGDGTDLALASPQVPETMQPDTQGPAVSQSAQPNAEEPTSAQAEEPSSAALVAGEAEEPSSAAPVVKEGSPPEAPCVHASGRPKRVPSAKVSKSPPEPPRVRDPAEGDGEEGDWEDGGGAEVRAPGIEPQQQKHSQAAKLQNIGEAIAKPWVLQGAIMNDVLWARVKGFPFWPVRRLSLCKCTVLCFHARSEEKKRST